MKVSLCQYHCMSSIPLGTAAMRYLVSVVRSWAAQNRRKLCSLSSTDWKMYYIFCMCTWTLSGVLLCQGACLQILSSVSPTNKNVAISPAPLWVYPAPNCTWCAHTSQCMYEQCEAASHDLHIPRQHLVHPLESEIFCVCCWAFLQQKTKIVNFTASFDLLAQPTCEGKVFCRAGGSGTGELSWLYILYDCVLQEWTITVIRVFTTDIHNQRQVVSYYIGCQCSYTVCWCLDTDTAAQHFLAYSICPQLIR